MREEQKQILDKYNKIKPDFWFKNPLDWLPIQFQLWGSLFTDMSVGYGKYFKSFAANLKGYLKDESLYVCGNKDDLILMFLHLCKK